MTKPLFSIIIAVYNIEEYLQRCLKSIDKQKNNFEVIMIDDGSTDNSGSICDEWAVDRDYAQVIHQKNQGISKTRNNGIHYSNGEYIVFVDPDDWIIDDFTETLQNLIESNGSIKSVDIVAYNFALVRGSKNNFNIVESGDSYPKKTASGEEVLGWILDTKIGNYACQYAIKRSIYINQHIEFPKMILYEDAATIYRLLFYAGKVVCTNRIFYNYFQRESSFSHTVTLSRTTEYFNLFDQMDKFFLDKRRPDLIKKSREYKLMRLLSAYLNMVRLDMKNSDKRPYYKKLKKMIDKNFMLNPSRKDTLAKELLLYTHLFKPVVYFNDWKNLR